MRQMPGLLPGRRWGETFYVLGINRRVVLIGSREGGRHKEGRLGHLRLSKLVQTRNGSLVERGGDGGVEGRWRKSGRRGPRGGLALTQLDSALQA
jgi:hypothetical protein